MVLTAASICKRNGPALYTVYVVAFLTLHAGETYFLAFGTLLACKILEGVNHQSQLMALITSVSKLRLVMLFGFLVHMLTS